MKRKRVTGPARSVRRYVEQVGSAKAITAADRAVRRHRNTTKSAGASSGKPNSQPYQDEETGGLSTLAILLRFIQSRKE